MFVVDIETSGLSAIKHGMLSLGAVHFETGQEFYGECRLTKGRKFQPQALEINGFTVHEILFGFNKQRDTELYFDFVRWAKTIDPSDRLLGGHNVGHFDILFLEEINERITDGHGIKVLSFPFSYRTVDLHSIAFAKFGKSLTHEQICRELGLPPEPKPHNALAGARSEAAAFRALLSNG